MCTDGQLKEKKRNQHLRFTQQNSINIYPLEEYISHWNTLCILFFWAHSWFALDGLRKFTVPTWKLLNATELIEGIEMLIFIEVPAVQAAHNTKANRIYFLKCIFLL